MVILNVHIFNLKDASDKPSFGKSCGGQGARGWHPVELLS
jgi:hypothetical protein